MQYIEFGKVTSAHGIKGEMKIYPYTDNIENILNLKKLYIDNIEYKINNIRFHKNMFIVKLDGINSIEEVEKLRDAIVLREVDEEEVLEEDTYYIKDLIGCTVYLKDGKEFGTLKDVFQTGANDVYVIETLDKKEVLIPAIKDVVKNINLAEKQIQIELMEGLI